MEANQTANLFYDNWVDNTHFVAPCHGWYRVDWSVTPAAGNDPSTLVETELRLGTEAVQMARSAGASTSSGFAIFRIDPGAEISIWITSATTPISVDDIHLMIYWIPWVDAD